ncbi:MAG: DUF507 family protein [Pseudobdellovibrionaceae bacterium]|jgi:hypothetical protein
MKITTQQISALAQMIFSEWKKSSLVKMKVDEKQVLERITEVIKENYEVENELDREVQKMVDDLEKQHGNTFQRHKMQQMVKQQLAKQRKIVL